MKVWPLKNTTLKNIPEKPSPGSFLEGREDRYHCGIDLYAPEGSDVVAIEEGIVVDIDILGTSSDHIIVNAKQIDLKIGNEVEFDLNYGALLSVMTSPYVIKKYQENDTKTTKKG